MLTILSLFNNNFYEYLRTPRLIRLTFINFYELLGQLGANIYRGILKL